MPTGTAVEQTGTEKSSTLLLPAPITDSHTVSFFPRGDSSKLLKAACLCGQKPWLSQYAAWEGCDLEVAAKRPQWLNFYLYGVSQSLRAAS